MASIGNRDLGYHFQLDLRARVYTAQRMDFSPSVASSRVSEPKYSGKIITTHTETVDTGERTQMFGYTARHVITKTQRTREGELQNESTKDAWYIDPPAAWLELNSPDPGAFYHLAALVQGQPRDQYQFTFTGERETGLLLRSKQIDVHYGRTQGTEREHDEHVTEEEVTEFSESPLAFDLFVPPANFRRVSRLPGGSGYRIPYLINLQWQMLKDTFALRGKLRSVSKRAV